MKIVSKKEFLKLPEGTVFFERKDAVGMFVGDLRIKGESIGDKDFFYTPISNPFFLEGEHSDNYFLMYGGEEREVYFDTEVREGLYDDSIEYFVLDKSEVKAMIDALTDAYNKINGE